MTCQVSLAPVAAAPGMAAAGGEVPTTAVRPQADLIPKPEPLVLPASLTGDFQKHFKLAFCSTNCSFTLVDAYSHEFQKQF